MACDWPVSATNGSTATLHGRELPTELPVQTLCTALAETALSYGLRLLSRIWQIGSRQRRDRTLQPLADLPARNFQVILRLKILPQLCRRTEISRQAQRHLGSDRSPPPHDLIDCRSRHTKLLCHPVGAQIQSCMKSRSKISPGCTGRCLLVAIVSISRIRITDGKY